MSGRIAPAVRAMAEAGVAFQLFYDYDPLADGEWPSGGASAQTVSLDRLQDTRCIRSIFSWAQRPQSSACIRD
jgi:hypothetical protein